MFITKHAHHVFAEARGSCRSARAMRVSSLNVLAVAVAQTCGTTPGGWVCPYGHGCPAGGCTGTGWQEWLKWHNVYRCMHNVPPIVWDMDVYQDCYNTFKDQSEMKHSDSYGVQPPAGPAGENLFKASYQANPQEAVASWSMFLLIPSSIGFFRISDI